MENATATASFDLTWLIQAVEELEQARAHDAARLEALEREVASSVKRRDSIEIGTAGKGGAMKAYLDGAGDPRDNDKIVLELRRVLSLVGGTPAPFDPLQAAKVKEASA